MVSIDFEWYQVCYLMTRGDEGRIYLVAMFGQYVVLAVPAGL